MPRSYLALIVVLLALFGCSSSEPIFDAPPGQGVLIVMKGREFSPPNAAFVNNENACEGKPIKDVYVDEDIQELIWFAEDKDFQVFRATTVDGLQRILQALARTSGPQSRTFFAYSGEGSDKGLISGFCRTPNGVLIGNNRLVTPELLIQGMARIPGKHAILINACQSGVFAQEAAKTKDFNGVVIAACDVGFATTPCESEGHSALYATFFERYKDHKVHDLSKIDITDVGKTCNNYRHLWVDFWERKGLPISYKSVVYVSSDFLF